MARSLRLVLRLHANAGPQDNPGKKSGEGPMDDRQCRSHGGAGAAEPHEFTTSPNVIWVDLLKFDLSAGAPVMMLDPSNPALSGNVTAAFKKADKTPY